MSLDGLVKGAKNLVLGTAMASMLYFGSGCGGGGGSTGGAIPRQNGAPSIVYDGGVSSRTVVATHYVLKEAIATDDIKVSSIVFDALPSSYLRTSDQTSTTLVSGVTPLSAGGSNLEVKVHAVDNEGSSSPVVNQIENVLADQSYVASTNIGTNHQELSAWLAKHFEVYNTVGGTYVVVDSQTADLSVNAAGAKMNHVQNSSGPGRGSAMISIDYNGQTVYFAINAALNAETNPALKAEKISFAITNAERLAGGQYALNSMSASAPIIEQRKTQLGL